jgi:excisionase family DNA binding protein
MGDWLTIKEAETLTGYHADHIRRLVRSGEVKARKVVIVWLVSRKSLDAYLRRQEQQGERRGRKKTV